MNELGWHICVVIPAQNEEHLLPRCLASVLQAMKALPFFVSTDIVVVSDRSTDRTANLAWRLLGRRGRVVESGIGAAGGARALGVQVALSRAKGPLNRCWIANTDADCIVPASWLGDQLCLAYGGVEAFAGTVSVDTFAEHGPEVPRRFRASYLIAPDNSHTHVHGANLGVRADVYLDGGQWGPQCTGEDHDLWIRLLGRGSRVISTAAIEVITSGRRVGRAPRGFAEALAAHNEAAA